MTCKYCKQDHDKLDPDGDGEFEPHRPPKFVEGVYKPHRVNREYVRVLLQASMLPQEHPGALHWALVDDEGYVRRPENGKPIPDCGDHIVGWDDGNEQVFRDGVIHGCIPEQEESEYV